MNLVCKVFLFQTKREDKTDAFTPPPFLHLLHWNDPCTCSPSGVKLHFRQTFPRPRRVLPTLGHTPLAPRVIFYCVNLSRAVNSFGVSRAWIAFARHPTEAAWPRTAPSPRPLPTRTTRVICPSRSLLPIPSKIIRLKPALVRPPSGSSIPNIPGGSKAGAFSPVGGAPTGGFLGPAVYLNMQAMQRGTPGSLLRSGGSAAPFVPPAAAAEWLQHLKRPRGHLAAFIISRTRTCPLHIQRHHSDGPA